MADMAQDNFSGSCTVVDSPTAILKFVWTLLFFGVGGYLMYTAGAEESAALKKFCAYLLFALGVLKAIVFAVNAKGYVVDVEGDTLSSPVAVSRLKAGQRTSTPCTGPKASFGAISFSFRSKGKRDELYLALVQINDMGTPILNR